MRCTFHKYHKHAACAPHACLCRVHARRTHTTSHVIHTLHACDIHPAHTKHAINLSYACCTCTAYLPLACQDWTLSKCTHSCLHRHTTCKNATSLLHIHCKHTQCMHAPGKQHSSGTHATLTCITDATYATCASMLQACQRHKLCACWNVCKYATLILNILQAH